MRKIILPILSVVALAIITGGILDGCTTEGNHSDTIDTVVLQPKQLLDLGDSTDVMTVTGVVTDGAMNSVMVEVESPGAAVRATRGFQKILPHSGNMYSVAG